MNRKKIVADLKYAVKQSKEFGILFSLKCIFYKYTHQTEKYIDNINKVLTPYILNGNNLSQSVIKKSEMPSQIPIWMFWWQGEEQMPDIVRICCNSVRSNLPQNSNLVLLTQSNYMNYVDIPDEILRKVQTGVFSITLFSDLLRNELLTQYGGFWIDATIYCAKPIKNEFLANSDYWSVKLLPDVHDKYSIGRTISNRMWGGFIQKAPPHGIVNSRVLQALKSYMLEHNTLAEYFIQNVFIRALYDNNDDVKTIIDNIPYSNPCLYNLDTKLNDTFDEAEWNTLVKDTTFFKLSWKRKYSPIDKSGEKTFYGVLLQETDMNKN